MISVCIPTFNGEQFLKLQLDSILNQLSPNDEIIISDDSSTDNTIKIIESYKDSRIKVLKDNRFYSPIFNLENALKVAKGDIILLADQDDIWENDKVSKMSLYLEIYDLVVSDCTVINGIGDILNESFFKLRKSRKGFWKNIYINSFLGCCMGFRKDLLIYALPFPKKTPMHDIWLGLIAEIYGKTFFTSDKLIKYRRHGENASAASEKSDFSFFYKLRYRLVLISNILQRYIKRKEFDN